MKLKAEISDLKKVLEVVGTLEANPEHGTTAVAIRESEIGSSYSARVGVGKVSAISQRYFEIRGKVFDDTYHKFTDSILKIEPKELASSRGEKYTCALVDEKIIRKMTEASWDDSFNGIDDLKEILQGLKKE